MNAAGSVGVSLSSGLDSLRRWATTTSTCRSTPRHANGSPPTACGWSCVDISDKPAFAAWARAESRGFHSACRPSEAIEQRRSYFADRRITGVYDDSLPVPDEPVATTDGLARRPHGPRRPLRPVVGDQRRHRGGHPPTPRGRSRAPGGRAPHGSGARSADRDPDRVRVDDLRALRLRAGGPGPRPHDRHAARKVDRPASRPAGSTSSPPTSCSSTASPSSSAYAWQPPARSPTTASSGTGSSA